VSATLSDDPAGTDSIRALKWQQRWTRLLAVVNEKDDDGVRREFSRAIRSGADAAVRRSNDEKPFLLAFRACWHDVPHACGALNSRTDFTLSRV